MKCFFCRRGFSQLEEKRRVEQRRWQDGTVHLYGEGMPDGPLSKAQGIIERVWHNKCYHAQKSREELEQARAADASTSNDEAADWRPQEVAEVEDLIGEGNRDNRGT